MILAAFIAGGIFGVTVMCCLNVSRDDSEEWDGGK